MCWGRHGTSHILAAVMGCHELFNGCSEQDEHLLLDILKWPALCRSIVHLTLKERLQYGHLKAGERLPLLHPLSL